MVALALSVPVLLKSRTFQVVPERTAFLAPSSSRILLKISGAVKNPGIYHVTAKKMADSVIDMAVVRCDRKTGIMAGSMPITVKNGDEIHVDVGDNGECLVSVVPMSVPEQLVLGLPLELERMTESDFDLLPGVGPVLAHRIVEYRQNNGGKLAVNDLKNVDGIGEKKFNLMRQFIQHAETKR